MFDCNYALIDFGNSTNIFAGARVMERTLAIDYEAGGFDLNDSTEPFIYSWMATSNSGESITISKKSGVGWQDKKTLAIKHTDFSFTFDQNMNHVIVFTYNNISYINFFDSRTNSYINKALGVSIITPRVTLDDKRFELLAGSEVICAYLRNGHLRAIKQSEDYKIEHTLLLPVDIYSITQIGMSTQLRMMFKCT